MEDLQRLILGIKNQLNLLQNKIDVSVDEERLTALSIEDLKNQITTRENLAKELMCLLSWLANKIDQRELKTTLDHKMFDDVETAIEVYKTYKEANS